MVYHSKRHVEVPTAVWVPIDKALERFTLATPSVAELQETISATNEAICIPATSTMPQTTVQALAPVPPQWFDELQGKLITPLQLAEHIDTKMTGWDEHLKVKAEPLRNWAHIACARRIAKEENQGSALQRPWRIFAHKTTQCFHWASSHLDRIVGKYKPLTKPNDQNDQKTSNNQTPINHQTGTDTGTDQLLAILQNQTRILDYLATGATRTIASPQTFTVNSEKATGTFTENQTARLLA